MRQTKEKKVKNFNILITGDNNYNNITKFNTQMQQIYNTITVTKTIATFGGKYGAEVLGQLYAQDKDINFTQFNMGMFNKSKKGYAQLYHVLLNIGVKWSDLVIIFSNIYTPKIKSIIKLCEKLDKEYIIIKE